MQQLNEQHLGGKMKTVTKPQHAETGFGHIGLIAAAVVVAVVAFIGYRVVSYHDQQVKASQKLTPITLQLNWLNNAQYAWLYTAVERGYYRAAGLQVTFKEVGESTDPLQVLASGNADYAISIPLEIVLGRDKGENVKAIAAINQTAPYAIAARQDANIKTPADFLGKVLGAMVVIHRQR